MKKSKVFVLFFCLFFISQSYTMFAYKFDLKHLSGTVEENLTFYKKLLFKRVSDLYQNCPVEDFENLNYFDIQLFLQDGDQDGLWKFITDKININLVLDREIDEKEDFYQVLNTEYKCRVVYHLCRNEIFDFSAWVLLATNFFFAKELLFFEKLLRCEKEALLFCYKVLRRTN